MLGRELSLHCSIGLLFRKENAYKNFLQITPDIFEAERFYTVHSNIYSSDRTVGKVADASHILVLWSPSVECMHRNPLGRCSIGHVLRGVDTYLYELRLGGGGVQRERGMNGPSLLVLTFIHTLLQTIDQNNRNSQSL